MAKSEFMAYVLSWGFLLVFFMLPLGFPIAIVGVAYLVLYRWMYKHKKPYFETFKGVV